MDKINIPYLPVYIGDVQKNITIKLLSNDEVGMLFKLWLIMWDANKQGYLKKNEKNPEFNNIAKYLNIEKIKLKKYIDGFIKLGLLSKDENGNIYSDMLLDWQYNMDKEINSGIY